MTATVEAPTSLPFTTLCPTRGNFPGEYSVSLQWKCVRFEGHEGECEPDALSRRMYTNYRAAAWERWQIPEEVHLNAEMLRHIVSKAIYHSDDLGVMWLVIREYIAFANFLRLVCP